MAIYNSIALGKARKSAGNVRFSIWKGIPVASQKPTSVANPRTPKQLNARARQTAAVAVFRRMPALIDSMYQFRAIEQSAYNAFVSANNKGTNVTVDGTPPVGFLEPVNFIIANQNVVLATCASEIVVDDIDFVFDLLVPSTVYSILVGVGNNVGSYTENTSIANFTSDVNGKKTVTATLLNVAIPTPSFTFCVIQNQINGEKFAFKNGI